MEREQEQEQIRKLFGDIAATNDRVQVGLGADSVSVITIGAATGGVREHTLGLADVCRSLTYVCVPMSGDEEKDTDFTHEVAREALASGEIPVCRRLLSPSSEMEENEIADAAEICGRVLAFGSPWSEETWAAVRAAKRSGVPVETFPADGWRAAFVNRANAEIERTWTMKKVFTVFVGRSDDDREQALAPVSLPATPYELLDALDAVQASRPEELYMEYLGEGGFQSLRFKMEPLTDSRSLRALNALAEELALMDEHENCAFEGLLAMEARDTNAAVPIPRLYNLACATDACHVIEASGDAEVGRFFVENGFFPELDELPEAALERLDYAKIGRERREAEGGVLLPDRFAYAERGGDIPEAFRDLDLTPPTPDYAVLLEIRPEREGESVLLKLPAAPEELAAFGQDADFRCRDCRIPSLRKAVESAGSLAEVNEAARQMREIPRERLPAFKALIATKGCGTLQEAREMYGKLDEYSLTPEIRSYDAAARRELRSLLSETDAERILPYVNQGKLGEQIMAERGQILTEYGAFCRKDGEPILEQPRTPEPERGVAAGKSQKPKKRNAPSR